MARQQIPQNLLVGPFTTTPVQLSSTSILCASFIIQADPANSDFIKLGNAVGRVFYIAPGRELAVNGDNLDNGTTAYVDLSQWYVESVGAPQNANVTYLERY